MYIMQSLGCHSIILYIYYILGNKRGQIHSVRGFQSYVWNLKLLACTNVRFAQNTGPRYNIVNSIAIYTTNTPHHHVGVWHEHRFSKVHYCLSDLQWSYTWFFNWYIQDRTWIGIVKWHWWIQGRTWIGRIEWECYISITEHVLE